MWLSNDFDSHIAQLPNIRNHSPRRPSVSGTPCQMSSHQWLWYHHLEASWLPCQRHCIHSARPIHRCDIRWRLAIIIQIQIHTSACGWVAHNGWVQCSQQCEYLLICLASRFMTCISSGCNAFRAALATTVARNGDVRYPNTNPKLNPVPNLYHTTNANPIANRNLQKLTKQVKHLSTSVRKHARKIANSVARMFTNWNAEMFCLCDILWWFY